MCEETQSAEKTENNNKKREREQSCGAVMSHSHVTLKVSVTGVPLGWSTDRKQRSHTHTLTHTK